MAFQFSNEGVPYHPPVQPEIPGQDRSAVQSINAGGHTAVSAFISMAIAAQRAKLEQEQMLQRADLAAKSLDVQKRGQDLAYDVGKYRIDEAYDRTGALRDRTKAIYGAKQAANDATDQYELSNIALTKDFFESANRIQAFDKVMQTKHPAGFADAVNVLEAQYGTAPADTGIPAQLRKLRQVANAQRIDVKFDPLDPRIMVPYGEVVNGLRNPATHDAYMNALKNAGHIKEEKDLPADASFWERYKPGVKMKDIPDLFTAPVIEEAATFDPSNVESRVPIGVPRSAAQAKALGRTGGTADYTATTSTRAGTLPASRVDNPGGAIDGIIEQAAQAIVSGKKDPAAVRKIFFDKTGQDGSLVDARVQQLMNASAGSGQENDFTLPDETGQ